MSKLFNPLVGEELLLNWLANKNKEPQDERPKDQPQITTSPPTQNVSGNIPLYPTNDVRFRIRVLSEE